MDTLLELMDADSEIEGMSYDSHADPTYIETTACPLRNLVESDQNDIPSHDIVEFRQNNVSEPEPAPSARSQNNIARDVPSSVKKIAKKRLITKKKNQNLHGEKSYFNLLKISQIKKTF